MSELIVNGRTYPLWGQFVEKKSEWIGGILDDSGDSMDKRLSGGKSMSTEIVDIELTPNGTESAYFSVIGKDFTCGGDVKYLGIVGGQEPWLTFSGYGGQEWRIKKP